MIIISENDYKKSTWSGGTTTEMFIYPEGASYAQRDFIFRISSATVDAPQSDFTVLPNVTRHITPLDGVFELFHSDNDGIRRVTLYPMQVDCFDGGVETRCFGNGRDFNLMTKGVHGRMMCFDGGKVIFSGDFLFAYALEDIRFGRASENTIKVGQLALFDEKGVYSTDGRCILICVKLG